jgi:hypothetical protein
MKPEMGDAAQAGTLYIRFLFAIAIVQKSKFQVKLAKVKGRKWIDRKRG